MRFLLWRLLGALGWLVALAAAGWLLRGGPGAVLRGRPHAGAPDLGLAGLAAALRRAPPLLWSLLPMWGRRPAELAAGLLCVLALGIAAVRARARARRRYVRLRVEAYRNDRATAESLVHMFAAVHRRLQRRWWRRLLFGQPGIALEIHHSAGAPHREGSPQAIGSVSGEPPAAWAAVSCPTGLAPMIESTLQGAYPNCRLVPAATSIGFPPAVLRLKKHSSFIGRAKTLDRFEQEREPPVNRLLTAMGAGREHAFVQLAVTPAPASFEAVARHLFRRNEAGAARDGAAWAFPGRRSMIEEAEVRGGLEVQHRPLFFTELRVIAGDRRGCERIAAELRAAEAENRLVERGTGVRHGLLGLYARRVQRGEGNPLPGFSRGVFASTELAAIWQLPSSDYATVPFARSSLPVAPAPPGVFRPRDGPGLLRDSLGPVSIHPESRRQNVAVPGTVEQGKSSFLVASVAEDLRRERCAVIVIDPKGDAADAAASLVPAQRTCTLLDLANPSCGFNPLAVAAPADAIADYVVAALKNLFTDADIRASSDRYLRNAIIAVLAYDRRATLWDAARLLSVGEEGYSYRRVVGAHVRTLPEFKEISEFFTAELTAQLADARSTTTAKLDAPVNKLARLLNSPSIKRVLLNESLRVDFDRAIADAEVLVVRGALGLMGAGNTSVVMQLLMGMLDAALARQQDLVAAEQRVAVALKIDEAPLVLNRGFAETIALKRSAGLETVACWQTDAQWVDREVRDQLDALFANRVYFATASARDARAAAALTMAEFSDSVRPGLAHLSTLGHPDVRLHLPRHHAIVSLTTPSGRQPPFIARTIPLAVDRERLALHRARQHERGGRRLTDLRQPHWERRDRGGQPSPGPASSRASAPPPCGPSAVSPGGAPPTTRRIPAAVSADPVDPPQAPARGGGPAESYRELVELDRAQGVRWTRSREIPAELRPDPTDLDVLALVAELRHVLSSQIHRRFNAERAATTTQRRLKRLADAGLLQRMQFHRRDGGGIPMCCAITAAGLHVLERHERLPAGLQKVPHGADAPRSPQGREQRLRQARRDVHAAGWTLALERRLGRRCAILGPEGSAISPPRRSNGERTRPFGPSDLRLPGGRVPHDFLRTTPTAERTEVERFETVRPQATVQTGAVDLLLELDDRLPAGQTAGRFERYDHFLSGWSQHHGRYGRRAEATPAVVFVCRDGERARELARRCDSLLCACRAYAGEYPLDWEYPGRRRLLFVCERDVHDGRLTAYGVPRLPPAVRVGAAHGDPRAGEASVETIELPCSA